MTTLEQRNCLATGPDAQDPLALLAAIAESRGPRVSDYVAVDLALQQLHRAGEHHAAREVLSTTFVTDCIHGWAHLKPYGYAGDHVTMDRLYTRWVSSDGHLAAWDRFIHAQPAARAVRNRKDKLVSMLRDLAARNTPARVLNVASGPARDIFEFFTDHPTAPVHVTCVDDDPRAIEYASRLCRAFNAVTFERRNALRLRPTGRYHLVWSAGLFDYFEDHQFVSVGRRLYDAVAPGGELVIGNFAAGHSSIACMAVLTDWHLHCRCPTELRALAGSIGAHDASVSLDQEEEGVNLFLRIQRE